MASDSPAPKKQRMASGQRSWGAWGFVADAVAAVLILLWLFFPGEVNSFFGFLLMAALYSVAGSIFLVFLVLSAAVILAASFGLVCAAYFGVFVAEGRLRLNRAGFEQFADIIYAEFLQFCIASFAVAITASWFFEALRPFMPGLLVVAVVSAAYLAFLGTRRRRVPGKVAALDQKAAAKKDAPDRR